MAATVLIVDNDALIRGILRSMFAGLGRNVLVAASGWEAIAHAARAQTSLILLDLNMPVMNGLVVCKRLRDLPGHADTPIVVLSGHDGEDVRRAAKLVGATLFLSKPFRPAALLQSVAGFMT